MSHLGPRLHFVSNTRLQVVPRCLAGTRGMGVRTAVPEEGWLFIWPTTHRAQTPRGGFSGRLCSEMFMVVSLMWISQLRPAGVGSRGPRCATSATCVVKKSHSFSATCPVFQQMMVANTLPPFPTVIAPLSKSDFMFMLTPLCLIGLLVLAFFFL